MRVMIALPFALVLLGVVACDCQEENGRLRSEVSKLKTEIKTLKKEGEEQRAELSSVSATLGEDLRKCKADLADLADRGPKPPSLGVRITIMFLNGLTHVLVIVSLAGLAVLLGRLVMHPISAVERSIRGLSVATGFLVYFGARAGGLSIPVMLSESLSHLSLVSTGLIGIAFPSMVGIATAWQLRRAIKASETGNVGTRVILLVSTFIVVLFSESYIASQQAPEMGALHLHLIPNIAFTTGLALYIILVWEPEALSMRRPQPRSSTQ